MARRTLIWHLGLADAARASVPAGLDAHRDDLAELGVHVAADRHESDLATHELLRTHAEAGLRRRDVEGQWARIADRVWSHKGVSVVSTPQLCAADKDQRRLALDPLIGVEVHVVLTVDRLAEQLYGAWVAELLRGGRVGIRKFARRVQRPALEPGASNAHSERFWAGHEVGSLVARWGWTMHADRIHLVSGDPATQWARLLGIAGLDVGALPPVVPAYVDPAAAALLREVNRRAEEPLSPQARAALLETWEADEESLVPELDVRGLAPLVAHWQTTLERAGHDVRGDLARILDPAGGPARMPGARARLDVAAQALAESLAETDVLREQVVRLEHEVETLDRKRRTWKRRAKEHTLVAAS